MSRQYLYDDNVLLNLQGIRMISKIDITSPYRKEEIFRLRIEYKGLSDVVEYETKEERDLMYESVAKAIAKRVK